MAHSKFDICSDALISIGASPITDFEGGSTESEVAAQLYQRTVENWLSLYGWRFATTDQQLSRLSAAPDTGWDAAYQQPETMLRLNAVKIGGKVIDYTRFKDQIHCNAAETDEVWAEWIYYPSEANWPAYFVTLIDYALQKRFAVALAGKLDIKREVGLDLDFQFRLAKIADAQQQTARRLPYSGTGTIMEVRRR
jgi:hypothetical protein